MNETINLTLNSTINETINNSIDIPRCLFDFSKYTNPVCKLQNVTHNILGEKTIPILFAIAFIAILILIIKLITR